MLTRTKFSRNGDLAPARIIGALSTYRDPKATDFADAWVGLEPTFQTKKSVRKWRSFSEDREGEDAYFRDPYMLKTEKKVAKAIQKRYRAQREASADQCLFAHVDVHKGRDPWGIERRRIRFYWADDGLEPFVVGFGLDPETFEFGIKPVPLAWFYEERFVAFLEEFIWQVPRQLGLSCAMAHGGGQFHLSMKTFLTGSLLADDIAFRLSHPELATWAMDFPEADNRPFRATDERKRAFESMLNHYWAGDFHPRALGVLTPENAYLDRGFGPQPSPRKRLMDPNRGPLGDEFAVFQTNFAFGRAVRWQALNVHPGYWQSAHPRDDGYRPDQIMRYSECNLNRLEIAGELHVKSDKVLEPERVPKFDAALGAHMLATEASWENRAQMTRTSAKDFVEALLLDAHHAQYLQAHPHYPVKTSLLQDQLLSQACRTLKRYGGSRTLARLHKEARATNLEVSRGRIKSDMIEPETLFWHAWRVLPGKEKAAVADEAICGFLEYVEQAAAMDPRTNGGDPMQWHRHRVHPVLWDAVEAEPNCVSGAVRREFAQWRARKDEYLARRPVWSQDKTNTAPWADDQGT